MTILVERLSDPIWQIGVGILVLLAPMLILVVRSADVPLSPRQKQRATVLVLLGCCACLLIWSAGMVLVRHDTSVPARINIGGTPSPPQLTLSPTPSPLPTPSPSPTAIPVLVPSTVSVLTTWCSAVNANDAATVWTLYSTTLQRTLLANKTRLTRLKGEQLQVVRCQLNDDPDARLDERKASGVLLLWTADGTGYADGIERPYELILEGEDHQWKISRINYCTVHGCIDSTGRFVP